MKKKVKRELEQLKQLCADADEDNAALWAAYSNLGGGYMSRLIEVIECSDCPHREDRRHRNKAGEWVADAYCAEVDLEIPEGVGYDWDFPEFCPLEE